MTACTPPAASSTTSSDDANARAPIVIADASSSSSSIEVARGATVSIPLDGFALSCQGGPTITVSQSDGGKRAIDSKLPGKGVYFLDDKFIGYGMCDVVVCAATTGENVDLVEHRASGTREVPAGSGSPGKAPVFRTVPLEGTVAVTIDYFASSTCAVPKSTTRTFHVR